MYGESSATLPAEQPSFRVNLQKLLAPPLLAFIGGSAGAVLLALGSGRVDVVMGNVATAYDKFPGLERSWFGVEYSIPEALLDLMKVLAFVVPLSIGLFAARLAGLKDWWSGLSAGITTAAFAMLGAMMFGLVWLTTAGWVIVPSLDDYECLAAVSKPSATAPAKNDPWPGKFASKERLRATYPGLQELPQEEQAQRIFSKIVADQVTRSAEAPWIALFLAVVMPGSMAFCGTLAAMWLLRRGDRFLAGLWPYVELALPGWLTLTMLIGLVVQWLGSWHLLDTTVPLGSLPRVTTSFWWVLLVTAVLYLAVVQRWNKFPRFMLAVSWSLLVLQNIYPPPPLVLTVLCHVGTALIVARQVATRSRTPKTISAIT
jgi:hypothetical protein